MRQFHIATVLALALTSVASAQEIAFVEKTYTSDGNLPARHLYLVNRDGTNKRQITSGKFNHPGFTWLDSNNLAYVEMANERVIEKKTSERHIFDANIYRYNLSSGTSKRIGTMKSVLSLAAVAGKQFQFFTTTQPKAATVSNSAIAISTLKAVTPTYNLQPVVNAVTEPARTGYLTSDIRTRWGLMRIYRPDGRERPLNRQETYGFEIYNSGYVQSAQLLGPVLNDVRMGQDGALYLVTVARNQNFAEMFLYRMASPRSVPTLVIRQIEANYFTNHPVWIAGRPGIW